MAKAASSEDLRGALKEHLEVTKGQVTRLEEVFEEMGMSAKAKPCAGMKGLIEEGEEVISEDGDERLIDLAIIGAAQRVEHYEMAAYGTARTMAERLGKDRVAELLEETLNEEKEADEKLTEVAEQIYTEVAEMDQSEEEEATVARGRKSSQRVGLSRA